MLTVMSVDYGRYRSNAVGLYSLRKDVEGLLVAARKACVLTITRVSIARIGALYLSWEVRPGK